MERTITTKENFFDGLKPSPDKEYKSAKLTELIKELKQFIEKGDVDGYWNFVHVSTDKDELTAKEKQFFLSAIVTDNGMTVMELISDIADLMDD